MLVTNNQVKAALRAQAQQTLSVRADAEGILYEQQIRSSLSQWSKYCTEAGIAFSVGNWDGTLFATVTLLPCIISSSNTGTPSDAAEQNSAPLPLCVDETTF